MHANEAVRFKLTPRRIRILGEQEMIRNGSGFKILIKVGIFKFNRVKFLWVKNGQKYMNASFINKKERRDWTFSAILHLSDGIFISKLLHAPAQSFCHSGSLK